MHHMGTKCAIWKPYGSYVLQLGGRGCQMGAAGDVWEPYELYGTCIPHVRQMAPYGRCMGCMGAI
jgi:hypothetical protein